MSSCSPPSWTSRALALGFDHLNPLLKNVRWAPYCLKGDVHFPQSGIPRYLLVPLPGKPSLPSGTRKNPPSSKDASKVSRLTACVPILDVHLTLEPAWRHSPVPFPLRFLAGTESPSLLYHPWSLAPANIPRADASRSPWELPHGIRLRQESVPLEAVPAEISQVACRSGERCTRSSDSWPFLPV